MTVTFSSSQTRRLRKLMKMPFDTSSRFTSYASASTQLNTTSMSDTCSNQVGRFIQMRLKLKSLPLDLFKANTEQVNWHHLKKGIEHLRGISKHYICCHLDQSWLYNDIIIGVSLREIVQIININNDESFTSILSKVNKYHFHLLRHMSSRNTFSPVSFSCIRVSIFCTHKQCSDV